MSDFQENSKELTRKEWVEKAKNRPDFLISTRAVMLSNLVERIQKRFKRAYNTPISLHEVKELQADATIILEFAQVINDNMEKLEKELEKEHDNTMTILNELRKE